MRLYSFPHHLLPSCHRCTTTYALNTDSTSSLNSSIMASVTIRPSVYPHGFRFHSYHHQSSYQDQAPVLPQPQPVVAKPLPTDPYYGHEETTKICARFIRYVFNCPPDSNQPRKFIFQSSCATSQLNISSTVPINRKPTESTVPLPKFIAYAFHCICLRRN